MTKKDSGKSDTTRIITPELAGVAEEERQEPQQVTEITGSDTRTIKTTPRRKPK